MAAVLPHYKQGPENKQVSTLIFGGQLVEPTTITAGTTDYTVKPASAVSVNVLGVAAKDANVISAQTAAPNTYGQPLIDISVLDDYTSVYYGGVDILVWYNNTANVAEGALLQAGANGTVTAFSGATYSQIVGRCTINGGVTTAMCTQQIGGLGASTFFLGRARIF
jgi:hypothetical protein